MFRVLCILVKHTFARRSHSASSSASVLPKKRSRAASNMLRPEIFVTTGDVIPAAAADMFCFTTRPLTPLSGTAQRQVRRGTERPLSCCDTYAWFSPPFCSKSEAARGSNAGKEKFCSNCSSLGRSEQAHMSRGCSIRLQCFEICGI